MINKKRNYNMSVNANNYIMSFSSPTVPRLDASNINTISIADMETRIK
jgi:hypothetical protein